MYSNNKQIRDVADVAARIMSGQQPVDEELKGGQVKLDKNHNGKIDGQDFKILKGQKKSEVVKEDDTGYQDRFAVKNGKAVKHNPEKGEHDEPHHVWADSPEHAVRKHATMNKPKTEQVERIAEEIDTSKYYDTIDFSVELAKSSVEFLTASTVKTPTKGQVVMLEEGKKLDEVKLADLPSRKIQGRAYGASKPEPHAVDTIKGPNDAELKKIEAEKKKKKFSEMVNLYQDKGLKSLSEMITKKETVEEGASEAEYNAQLDVAKFKANTKDDDGAMPVKQKTKMVSKAGELAVKTEETHTMVQVIDLDGINGVQHSEIDLADIQERSLTTAEKDKKEDIVHGMKKGLAGFKDRYGDRAKSVMYATATKNAKGE
jgi:hypothetical protein